MSKIDLSIVGTPQKKPKIRLAELFPEELKRAKKQKLEKKKNAKLARQTRKQYEKVLEFIRQQAEKKAKARSP
jgi:hypothetical protein